MTNHLPGDDRLRGELSQQRFEMSVDGMNLELTVTNDTSTFNEISSTVLAHVLSIRTVTRGVQMELTTALEEALANAVVHGNLELPSEARSDPLAFQEMIEDRRRQSPYCRRQVALSARVTSTVIECLVRDQGPGFDPENVPPPPLDDFGLAAWGNGLTIIRAFMDQVQHNERGNELLMIKQLPTLESL